MACERQCERFRRRRSRTSAILVAAVAIGIASGSGFVLLGPFAPSKQEPILALTSLRPTLP